MNLCAYCMTNKFPWDTPQSKYLAYKNLEKMDIFCGASLALWAKRHPAKDEIYHEMPFSLCLMSFTLTIMNFADTKNRLFLSIHIVLCLLPLNLLILYLETFVKDYDSIDSSFKNRFYS